MPVSESTFLRREQKYLLTSDQRIAVEKALRQHMVPDSHGESLVCNIYCDTPDYRLIRKSVEKPDFKEKLRLRCYGTAKAGTPIFVEMKRKMEGIVYKRRLNVPEQTAMDFLAGKGALPDTQIGRELTYFRDFYGSLIPKMYLSYERSAWFDSAGSDLRLTLDRNILWRTDRLLLSEPSDGRPLLPEGMSLMEIKAEHAMPLWLVEVLNTQKIRQTSFSKCGRAYETLLRESKNTTEGAVYHA